MKYSNGTWSNFNVKLILLFLVFISPFTAIADDQDDTVVTDFYNSYVSSLIGDKNCRNIPSSIDDTFLLEFPEAMVGDEGIFMTNATSNTSLYFQVKKGSVVGFSVENGLMASSPSNDVKTGYFCVISAAQSALHPKVKRSEFNKKTNNLYSEYLSNKRTLEDTELYKHSFTLDDASLIYKFENKG